MLLSQLRQGIFECAGGNSAGPKGCWCQSLHEYKAEIPTQFWKQALRGICPCKSFWGSLMSQIFLCAGSALCHFIPSVFDHQLTRQDCSFALRNLVHSCLTHSKRQWQHQRPSWHAVYWPLLLHWHQAKKNSKSAGIVSKQELFRAAVLSPQKPLWAKSNFETSKPSRKKKPAFL